jgi:hypothetical protein
MGFSLTWVENLKHTLRCVDDAASFGALAAIAGNDPVGTAASMAAVEAAHEGTDMPVQYHRYIEYALSRDADAALGALMAIPGAMAVLNKNPVAYAVKAVYASSAGDKCAHMLRARCETLTWSDFLVQCILRYAYKCWVVQRALAMVPADVQPPINLRPVLMECFTRIQDFSPVLNVLLKDPRCRIPPGAEDDVEVFRRALRENAGQMYSRTALTTAMSDATEDVVTPPMWYLAVLNAVNGRNIKFWSLESLVVLQAALAKRPCLPEQMADVAKRVLRRALSVPIIMDRHREYLTWALPYLSLDEVRSVTDFEWIITLHRKVHWRPLQSAWVYAVCRTAAATHNAALKKLAEAEEEAMNDADTDADIDASREFCKRPRVHV